MSDAWLAGRRATVPMLLWLVLLCAGCSGSDRSRDELSARVPAIGRMKVSVLPEYDDPGVLTIYDGRFEDAASYPIHTSFLVPEGSVISDACSVSHEGRHFCQLYKTARRDGVDEVSLLLPFPNFYLSFHAPRPQARAGRKELAYLIRSNHRVRVLEVEVQQPLRSTAFEVTLARGGATGNARTIGVVDGFDYLAYRFDDVDRNQEIALAIRYAKSDPNPSVDIKYASMRENPREAVSQESRSDARTTVYLLFGTAVVAMAALLGWILHSRRTRRGKAS